MFTQSEDTKRAINHTYRHIQKPFNQHHPKEIPDTELKSQPSKSKYNPVSNTHELPALQELAKTKT